MNNSSRLSNCFHHRFQDILLVIVFSYALYDHIPLLKSLYSKAFPNMLFCGPDRSTNHAVVKSHIHKGYYSYKCLSQAMKTRQKYRGYLMIMDDVLINFWNFKNYNLNQIWEGPEFPIAVGKFHRAGKWYWWGSRWGLRNCIKSLEDIKANFSIELKSSTKTSTQDLFQNLLQNRNQNFQQPNTTKYGCFRGRSDVAYIPKRFVNTFIHLSETFSKYNVFLEIALPTILRMLDSSRNYLKMNGVYMPGRNGTAPVFDSKYVWAHYTDNLDFIHPVKLNYGNNSVSNLAVLEYLIKEKVNELTSC